MSGRIRSQRYRQKLSGPLLDRIDLRLPVPRLTKDELLGADGGEPSGRVRARVEAARERQRARYAAHRRARATRTCPGPVVRRERGSPPAPRTLLARAVDASRSPGAGSTAS